MVSMAEDPAANGKKEEEEEFSTGPLSVLMLSVKNNTQDKHDGYGYILFRKVPAVLPYVPRNSDGSAYIDDLVVISLEGLG